MKYTNMPKELAQELNKIKKEPYSEKACFSHPSIFAQHYLGIPPYRYQHQIMKRFRDFSGRSLQNNRLMVCKSRQIGISWCYAMLAVWYAFCNKAGTGPFKDTKVGVISRSDKQATKFMGLVQKLVWNSPLGLESEVIKDRKHSLSKTELHFKNGWIKSYPPTDACRGETFDLVIVDEASFVDTEIFRDAIEPTVSAVDGKILLSSTPNGQKGFFFELFDPMGVRTEHEYVRFWYHWQICENEIQKRLIRQKQKYAKETGTIKNFDQEYNALFTADEESFFEDRDVERGCDRELIMQYENNGPCSLGIDYGLTQSATCLTVVTQIKDRIQVLWQFAQVNFDENLLMDTSWEHSIPNLCKRYNIEHVVVDDCPSGHRTNTQLENEGYPVQRFNFRSDEYRGVKNRGYYMFKAALRRDKIKYPELRKLMAEMKSLQEMRMDGGKYFKIKAPRNYADDRCDSLMIASHPFLVEGGSFKSTIVEYKEAFDKIRRHRDKGDGRRYDHEWDTLRVSSGQVPTSMSDMYGKDCFPGHPRVDKNR